MKCTILLVGVILAVVPNILGDDSNPETSPAVIGRALFTTRTVDVCNKGQTGPMGCSNDCMSMRFCMNGKELLINCQKQTGKRYCDMQTNSCSDYIDTCYNNEDYCAENFGIFPDLLNCTRYVYCDPMRVYPMECEHHTLFDYKTKSCGEDVPCATYSKNTGCKTRVGQLVKHPNPKWFVYCGGDKPILGECAGNSTFDEETASCKFKCENLDWPAVGNYPDEFDINKYHICYKSGNKWITKEAKCPPSAVFDYYERICRRSFYPETPSTTITTTTNGTTMTPT